MVADDAGHIGWSIPAAAAAPKRWGERRLPGTGEAEWRGLLVRQHPRVDRPAAGLARELEQPAVGRLDQRRRRRAGAPIVGDLNRGNFLDDWSRGGGHTSLDAVAAVERSGGTIAEQRPLWRGGCARRGRRDREGEGAAGRDLRLGRLLRPRGRERHGRPGARGVERAQGSAGQARAPRGGALLARPPGASHPYDAGGAGGRHRTARGGAGPTSQGRRERGRDRADQRASARRPGELARPAADVRRRITGIADKPQLKFYDRGTWSAGGQLGP